MNEPYRDAIGAIRAALNVDARSLYKPASWQHQAAIGYREELPLSHGDTSKLERFEQDCMTAAFLHQRMPPHLWAVIVVRHALRPANQAEFDRLKVSVLIAAGHCNYDDIKFARWAVANWGGKLDGEKARWDRWASHEKAISTLKRHYGQTIKPQLNSMREHGENTAARLLSDAGLIVRRNAA